MGIRQLNDLVFFIEELNEDNNIELDQPTELGKWSISEIISHLWLWDKYSLDLMLPLVQQGVTLKFIDHTAINSNAESFAKTLQNKTELIQLFKETRNELIATCNSINEDLSFYVGKREYNIESYVQKFITSHDQHHMKQIKGYLEKR